MIRIRPSKERGPTARDWLDGKHTFSFGDYYDPQHMGFGVLRVINEDKIKPATGFGTHPHRDMEIITYVLEGALAHKDSLGTGSTIQPGDVQRMSAGTGILHSEFNASEDNPVHLLQIWIIPEKKGIPPSYEQKNFTKQRRPNTLTLLASHDGRDESLTIHQNANMYVLDLEKGQTLTYSLESNRMAWIQMARGRVQLNQEMLEAGDGASVTHETTLEFTAKETSEILIFDLEADFL